MFSGDAQNVHKGNTLIVIIVCYLHLNGAFRLVGVLLERSFVYSGGQFFPPLV